MTNIRTSLETKRGCGYRQPGGLYLMGNAPTINCYRLPIPIEVCESCGHTVEFFRGFKWVTSEYLKLTGKCDVNENNEPIMSPDCKGCYPLCGQREKMGLMWIGKSFYKTTEQFLKEARAKGISKRVSAVPRKFKIGHDVILLAHQKAVNNEDCGIFYSFTPSSVEYIVTGKETEEELEALEKRGYELVKVIRDKDQQLAI